MAKTILFTGGNGFIGSHLASLLFSQGYEIVFYTKNTHLTPSCYKTITSLEDIENLPQLDVVINLAGAPIDGKRWTTDYQKIIFDSRINTTNDLITHLRKFQNFPKTFISASAVGYYLGHKNSCTEDTPIADVKNFSNQLCKAWEESAKSLTHENVRVCSMRIAPVLGLNGGLLKKAVFPFKCGLGIIFGNGTQIMPWIHLEDCLNAFVHILQNENLEGAFNIVAPEISTNEEFSEVLAGLFSKKPLMHLSVKIVRLLFGRVADETMLASIHVIPKHLQDTGFVFKYPGITNALKSFCQ